MVQVIRGEEVFPGAGREEKPLVLEFISPTCQHCRLLSGVLEELSQQYPDVLFAATDIAEKPELAAQFDIKALPTLLFFKRGAVRERLTGAVHPQVIRESIRKITE